MIRYRVAILQRIVLRNKKAAPRSIIKDYVVLLRKATRVNEIIW